MSRMGNGNQLGPANGSHDKLRARREGRPAGIAVQNRSDTDRGPLAKLPRRLANPGKGIGRGQGDFHGHNASRDQRLE